MKVKLPNSFGDMQKRIKEMQEQLESLETKEYEGSSGGGEVRVTVLGNLTISHIAIEPDAYEDKDMLPDLILTACNSALRSALDEKNKISSEMTSGLNIPGLT